jgi:hypothetical protein
VRGPRPRAVLNAGNHQLDPGSAAGRCTARILIHQCPLWVISNGAGRRHTTVRVRFTPESGQIADIAGRPLSANSVLTRRSKTCVVSWLRRPPSSVRCGKPRPSSVCTARDLRAGHNLVLLVRGCADQELPMRVRVQISRRHWRSPVPWQSPRLRRRHRRTLSGAGVGVGASVAWRWA